MPIIISDVTRTLHSLNGADVVHLKKGKQVSLTQPLYAAYVKHFDTPTIVEESKPKKAAPKELDPVEAEAAAEAKKLRLDAIGQAILEIQEGGKAEDFTASGDIRLSVLKDIVGFDVTGTDRDEALSLLDTMS